MLSIFTIPKPFEGHNGVIQRNAIRSWTKLIPECEIMLFGDDDGVGDFASEVGAKYYPKINKTEQGTPLLDTVFQVAQKESKYDLLIYVNADIIFNSTLISALKNLTWY